MKSNEVFDLIIVGGGAAGLFAAIVAANNNKNVCILERNDRVGKKILATGNGKCNLTNAAIEIENSSFDSCYQNNNVDFIKEIISKFDNKRCLEYFYKLGLLTKNINDYYYPFSEQAASVLNVLRMKCDELGVCLLNNVLVKGVKIENNIFIIDNKYKAKNVLIATGGKASPKTGSDGIGYEIAKKFNHKIIKPHPALTGIKCKGSFKSISGVRIKALVSAYSNKTLIAEDTGNLQLTDYGVSGIPVFNISRHVGKCLNNNENISIHIDFLPDITIEELKKHFINIIKTSKNRSVSNILNGIINKKIGEYIIRECGIKLDYVLNLDNDKDHDKIDDICKRLKNTVFAASEINNFDNAQVTAGGIDTNEIDPKTMESKKTKGLYFAGEVIDVDGICGGFNLHFAWASAYICGNSIE